MKNTENELYCGDNLAIMRRMSDESVDLIYLDPPFFSGQNYEVIWGDGSEVRSFKDTEWYRVECPKCQREVIKADKYCPKCGTSLEDAKVTRKNDIWSYIDWMVPRLKEMHRILKPTGSIYLHVDWHAVHYLKIEMDRIFGNGDINKGMKCFKNHITWQRSNSKNNANKKFNEISDYILFYTKSNDYTFNQQYITNENVGTQPIVSKKSGKFYCDVGTSRYFKDIDKTIMLDDEHGWRWKQDKIDEFLDDGGKFEYNKYPRKVMPDKKAVNNIWVDMYMHPSSKELIGYPTQKPEALLERIIKASSNPGDVVCDPFCGCGTSAAVAQKLERQYIGIDISPVSVRVIAERVHFPIDEIIGLPRTTEEISKMEPHEFQNWVCKQMSAKNTSPDPNKASGADGGIDGIIHSPLLNPNFHGAPIQVKHSKAVGKDTVQKLFAEMDDRGKEVGFIVALSFGSGAKEWVAKYKSKGKVMIHLLTAEDIVDAQDFGDIALKLRE